MRVRVLKDCLRRFTVVSSSHLANVQYDLHGLAGVMEKVCVCACALARVSLCVRLSLRASYARARVCGSDLAYGTGSPYSKSGESERGESGPGRL